MVGNSVTSQVYLSHDLDTAGNSLQLERWNCELIPREKLIVIGRPVEFFRWLSMSLSNSLELGCLKSLSFES